MKQSIDRIPTTGNFTSRRLLASLAAAGALLSTAACADEVSGAPTPTISTEAAPTTPEKLPETFTKERERAKETALQVADHLLDLMEDPRSHTETLDTGVEGIANKPYIVDNLDGPSPELRALYNPDKGSIYILGVDSTYREDGEQVFNGASATFIVGTESRIELAENAGNLTASDIRGAVFTGDSELLSLGGNDQWGFSDAKGSMGEKAGIMFMSPEMTGKAVEGIYEERDNIVTTATDPHTIQQKNETAIDVSLKGLNQLRITS